jgi:aminopeptidase-like protein
MPDFYESPILTIPVDYLIDETEDLLKRLYPLCRSITGNDVRNTLKILQELVELDITEISSGTKCYDWVVPDEWNINDAFILDSSGNKIIDFKKNNLHVVNYSSPFEGILSFDELKNHLFTLPDLPDAIPYRTSYYNRNWGFCIAHREYLAMDPKENYFVKIDSSLTPGSLTLGDSVIHGTSGSEFIISTYCCHPSLANDNLSGIVLWTLLLRELKKRKLRHTYRFVIVPETIGSIAYLSRNESIMKRIEGGLVITTVAGPGSFGYKQSYLGNSIIDRVVHQTMKEFNTDFISYPFDINGSDERQYSSPFFRIPIGTICKDKYYEYSYYHTSLDNLDFISASNLVQTLKIYLHTIENLEMNKTYHSLNPKCEPQLGKRGLYPKLGGQIKQNARILSNPEESNPEEKKYKLSDDEAISQKDIDLIGWIMFDCDGKSSLLDIAEKRNFLIRDLYQTAEKLMRHNLIEENYAEGRN